MARKARQTAEAEPVVEAQEGPTMPVEAPKQEARTITPTDARIASSRDALKQKLEPGQKFFEAPDGTIIVGEADRSHVFYRQGNNGEGMWINPKR